MNIELFEGQSCLVHVKLPEDWEVYGGTPKGEFMAERESSDSVLVTVPAMEAEFTPLVPYELFARRILDGREWLVLSGQVHVRRRYSEAGGGVSAIEYFVEPQLVEDGISSSPQIIIGIPGPQGPKGDKGDPGDGNVTAEAIQAVVPIAWGEFAVQPTATETDALAMGDEAKATNHFAITIGARFIETVNGGNVIRTCTTEGTGSITIGAGANTLNNGSTESSNSVTIGCKAENKGADSVVIGAQASGIKGSVVLGTSATGAESTVCIGPKSEAKGAFCVSVGLQAKVHSVYGVAIGTYAQADGGGVAVGYNTRAKNIHSMSLCMEAIAGQEKALALGYKASVNDFGATVIRSTASDGTYTQLYFSGANTPLANTYHDGAPMLGYVTKDSAGNIVAAGTRSLIELLTDNSTFAPASLDENGEWVMPKVFHPSDLDMPTEETSEPEEYTPLPVYPIVEPADIFGDNGTLEQGDTENTSPATNS